MLALAAPVPQWCDCCSLWQAMAHTPVTTGTLSHLLRICKKNWIKVNPNNFHREIKILIPVPSSSLIAILIQQTMSAMVKGRSVTRRSSYLTSLSHHFPLSLLVDFLSHISTLVPSTMWMPQQTPLTANLAGIILLPRLWCHELWLKLSSQNKWISYLWLLDGSSTFRLNISILQVVYYKLTHILCLTAHGTLLGFLIEMALQGRFLGTQLAQVGVPQMLKFTFLSQLFGAKSGRQKGEKNEKLIIIVQK